MTFQIPVDFTVDGKEFSGAITMDAYLQMEQDAEDCEKGVMGRVMPSICYKKVTMNYWANVFGDGQAQELYDACEDAGQVDSINDYLGEVFHAACLIEFRRNRSVFN